mgnify:FL=1
MSRDFDGIDDDIEVANVFNTQTNPLSQLCWVYPDSYAHLGATGNEANVFVQRGAGGVTWMNVDRRNGNQVLSSFLGGVNTFATTDILVGQWYFLGVTVDSLATRTIRLYVNAVMETSRTVTVASATGVYRLGKAISPDDAREEWDGLIAHMHLYNRVLSADEMRQVMSLPGSVSNGLQLYMPLSGWNAPEIDLSGNNRTGTVTGAIFRDAWPPINGMFVPGPPGGAVMAGG